VIRPVYQHPLTVERQRLTSKLHLSSPNSREYVDILYISIGLGYLGCCMGSKESPIDAYTSYPEAFGVDSLRDNRGPPSRYDIGGLTLSNNLNPSWIPRRLSLPSPNAHASQTNSRNRPIPIPKLHSRPHFRNSPLQRDSSINPLLPSQWEIEWCPLGGGIITSIRGVAYVALPSV
jgi:hypothetical protein